MPDYRICIRDQLGILRKITKIVPYTTSDPGFAAMVPYHRERQGFLLKHSVQYTPFIGHVTPKTAIPYTASDRVKLSVHFDGFVQFSGQDTKRIVSGRDPVTGEPKGIGVVFDQPIDIRTGPLFAICLWGVEEFEPHTSTPPACVEFTEEDIYNDRILYRGQPRAAYMVEFFMFSSRVLERERRIGPRGDYVRVELPRSDTLIAYRHDLRVIELSGQRHFLGCIVSKGTVSASSSSGFQLSGPSFAASGSNDFVTIRAFYPGPEGWPAVASNSLDRDRFDV